MSCLRIIPDTIFEFLWLLYFLRLCIQLSFLKFPTNPWHRRKTHISRYRGCEQLILRNFLISWSRVGTQTLPLLCWLLQCSQGEEHTPGVPWSALGHTYSFPRNTGVNMGKSATFSQQCRESPGMGELEFQGLHQLWSVSLFLLFREPTEDELKDINDHGLSSLTRKQGISQFPRELGLHL